MLNEQFLQCFIENSYKMEVFDQNYPNLPHVKAWDINSNVLYTIMIDIIRLYSKHDFELTDQQLEKVLVVYASCGDISYWQRAKTEAGENWQNLFDSYPDYVLAAVREQRAALYAPCTTSQNALRH